MKQFKQYQTESLTKLGRENIKNKLKCLIPNYNSQKDIMNKEKHKNQGSTDKPGNSKISMLTIESNQMKKRIVSKKWLLKNRKLQSQNLQLEIPQFFNQTQIRLKVLVNCQFIQKY